jgi:7-carboxy-7-deazaguanine synthase
MSILKVNEIFGPTIQGEGSAAGRHCLFVRLANCNLECTFCDTPYTWAFTDMKAERHREGKKYDRDLNSKHMTSARVAQELGTLWNLQEPTIVVFSGGEPLMQAAELAELADILAGRDLKHEVHIETAGTILPVPLLDRWVTQYNISPKLGNSGNRRSKRYKPDVLKFFATQTTNSWFKFVVEQLDDFAEIDYIVRECRISPNRVMVMPEGTTAELILERAKDIVPEALKRGWGISSRLHVLLWGDERGR